MRSAILTQPILYLMLWLQSNRKNPAPPQRHKETQDCCSSSQICICCITSQPRPFGNIQASASIRLTHSSSNAISAASVFTFRWISVGILKPRTLLCANQELYNHPSTSGTRTEVSGYSLGIGFWNFSTQMITDTQTGLSPSNCQISDSTDFGFCGNLIEP